jgi:gp16 family phage-associated protein
MYAESIAPNKEAIVHKASTKGRATPKDGTAPYGGSVEMAKRAREAKARMEEAGVSIAAWASARGFNLNLVYQVLNGQRACRRGASHLIAIELGLKDGSIVSAAELNLRRK